MEKDALLRNISPCITEIPAIHLRLGMVTYPVDEFSRKVANFQTRKDVLCSLLTRERTYALLASLFLLPRSSACIPLSQTFYSRVHCPPRCRFRVFLLFLRALSFSYVIFNAYLASKILFIGIYITRYISLIINQNL